MVRFFFFYFTTTTITISSLCACITPFYILTGAGVFKLCYMQTCTFNWLKNCQILFLYKLIQINCVGGYPSSSLLFLLYCVSYVDSCTHSWVDCVREDRKEISDCVKIIKNTDMVDLSTQLIPARKKEIKEHIVATISLGQLDSVFVFWHTIFRSYITPMKWI
jgi:hypothetical protein